MMTGKKNICLMGFISACIFLGTLLFPSLDWAGNKKHVENRVEDLDKVNKEIVSGFPDIPQSGTVKYKAIVIESSNDPQVKIIEKQIDMTPTSESPIKTTKQKNANQIKTQTLKIEME